MPLLVSCDDLQPGMRLAEAFLHRGRTMLPGGKTLSADDVDILRRKYPEAMLKVGDPVLDSVVQFENDARELEVAATVTQQITSAMADVQQRLSNHTNLSGIDFGGIRNTVSSVIDYLKNNPVSAALINRMKSDESYLAEHAGNVFYLSMVLGSGVKDYVVRERQRQTAASNLSAGLAMDLMPLGLGAMLMDIGMTPLQHLFKPGYVLTEEDRQALVEHPRVGADMLPDSMPSAAKMIVRWHHENFDGTGYPDKKPGASLHVFVRIARICDAFDAATSEKFYKQAKSPVRALWEMTYGPYKKFYDPVLMKVFASIIQPFPIGAKLKLADGRTAVVVKYNRRTPFQPTVVIAFDAEGNRIPADQLQPPVNVGDGNELRLDSYGAEDLRYVQEMSDVEAKPAERGRFGDLMEAVFP
ncbi:MAG: HD-GYP domain-containing protein [Phycisphaerae bacterium]